MEHLRNILKGMAAAGDVLSNHRPYRNTTNGFAEDNNSLRNDAAQVITEFNQQIQKEYGKQEYAG